MKIRRTEQLDYENVEISSNDFLIVASGYEVRSTFILESLLKRNTSLPKIYVLSFKDKYTSNNVQNDTFYTDNNCEIFEAAPNSSREILAILKKVLQKLDSYGIQRKIFVDISSMSRVWYGSILSYLNVVQSDVPFSITFFYSLALYEPPIYNEKTGLRIEPLQEYVNISIPDKPSALIIGLGYNKNQAYGIKESLDVEEIILFCTDKSSNADYYLEVKKQNSDLLKIVDPNNIIYYPIMDIKYTENLVHNICKRLSDGFRIILAPCGPKIFTFLCFIIANLLDDIDIWRITTVSYSNSKPSERRPSGKILAYKISYE